MDPLGQQVAAIGKVQKILLLLAPLVLEARGRHVPSDARTARALEARVRRGQRVPRSGDDTNSTVPTTPPPVLGHGKKCGSQESAASALLIGCRS